MGVNYKARSCFGGNGWPLNPTTQAPVLGASKKQSGSKCMFRSVLGRTYRDRESRCVQADIS